ncbi:hypothetical protein BDW66DRAFT_129919 [Aspergillus desertorum]
MPVCLWIVPLHTAVGQYFLNGLRLVRTYPLPWPHPGLFAHPIVRTPAPTSTRYSLGSAMLHLQLYLQHVCMGASTWLYLKRLAVPLFDNGLRLYILVSTNYEKGKKI